MSSLIIIISLYLSFTALACQIPGLPSVKSPLSDQSVGTSRQSPRASPRSPRPITGRCRRGQSTAPLPPELPSLSQVLGSQYCGREQTPFDAPSTQPVLPSVASLTMSLCSLAPRRVGRKHCLGPVEHLRTTGGLEDLEESQDQVRFGRRMEDGGRDNLEGAYPMWPPHWYHGGRCEFSFTNSRMLSRGTSRETDSSISPSPHAGILASLEQRLMALWETGLTASVGRSTVITPHGEGVGRAQAFANGAVLSDREQGNPVGPRRELQGLLISLNQDKLSVGRATSSIMTFFIGRRLKASSSADGLIIAYLSKRNQASEYAANKLVRGLVCIIRAQLPERQYAIARDIRGMMHVGVRIEFSGMDRLQAGEAYVCAQIVPNVRRPIGVAK